MSKIIIIPFSLPWDWPADYEKQTALSLSRLGFKVVVYLDNESRFFLNKKNQKYPNIKNIIFYSPIFFVPFKRFRFVRTINQFINLNYVLLKFGLNKGVVLWSLNYRFYNFPKLFIKITTSIYDCVELPSSRNKKLNRQITIMNNQMIKNSNYFFVDSPTLGDYFEYFKPVVLPQGFDLEGFKIKNKEILPIRLPTGKPIIGYIGGINYRLDYKLIYELVKNNPQWNFVFVGSISVWPSEDMGINTKKWISKLIKYNNFYIYDALQKKYMSSLINKFSVCLIPYNIKIKFNYYSRAMKFYEYLFLNKPIVSTPILESIKLNTYVEVAQNLKDFIGKIKSRINYKFNKLEVESRIKLCIDNTWTKKIEKIIRTVEI